MIFRPGGGSGTYIPLGLELLQPNKRVCHRFIGNQRLVLLQAPLADLGVVSLGDGILEEGLFELVDGDEDAEDLGERVLQVTFGACVGELNLLYVVVRRLFGERQKSGGPGGIQRELVRGARRGMVKRYSTSSRLIVAESVDGT